jgi:hypothetical protein
MAASSVFSDRILAGRLVTREAQRRITIAGLPLEHALRRLFAYLRAVVAPTAVCFRLEDWAAATGARGFLHLPSMPPNGHWRPARAAGGRHEGASRSSP